MDVRRHQHDRRIAAVVLVIIGAHRPGSDSYLVVSIPSGVSATLSCCARRHV